jgi:hypothetical protein
MPLSAPFQSFGHFDKSRIQLQIRSMGPNGGNALSGKGLYGAESGRQDTIRIFSRWHLAVAPTAHRTGRTEANHGRHTFP